MSLLTTLERRGGRRHGRDPDDDAYDDADGWDDDEPAIDPRIEARRRDVRTARAVRHRRIALVVAIVVTLVGVAYGITRSALLDINTIDVHAGAHETPPDIRNASGLRPGDRLVDLDLDRAAAAIRAMPWVRDVTIDRSWRGTIDIAVTERTPAAAVHAGAAGWLVVDTDRRVLAVSTVAPDGLPVIEGVASVAVGQTLDPSAQDAITVARALSPGLRTRVIAVDATVPTQLLLTVRPAGVIRFGSADQVEQKIVSLQAVYAQADLTNLCAVDIRVPDAPVLTRGAPCA